MERVVEQVSERWVPMAMMGFEYGFDSFEARSPLSLIG